VALLPALKAVALVCRAVPPDGGDVEARVDGKGSVRLDRAVPPALEPGWAVVLRRYCLHYRPPLEPVDGSVLSTTDWFV
jgi:hypothetical protein